MSACGLCCQEPDMKRSIALLKTTPKVAALRKKSIRRIRINEKVSLGIRSHSRFDRGSSICVQSRKETPVQINGQSGSAGFADEQCLDALNAASLSTSEQPLEPRELSVSAQRIAEHEPHFCRSSRAIAPRCAPCICPDERTTSLSARVAGRSALSRARNAKAAQVALPHHDSGAV